MVTELTEHWNQDLNPRLLESIPKQNMRCMSEARNGIRETFICSFIKESVEMERGICRSRDSD